MIMVCAYLEKAYDNVNRDFMWNVLEEYELEEDWRRQLDPSM